MSQQSFSLLNEMHGVPSLKRIGFRDCDYDHKFTSPTKHYSPSAKSTWCNLWSALDLRGLFSSGIHLSRLTYVPLFLQSLKKKISPTSPLVVLSAPKKHKSLSDLQDCSIWTWKYTSKLPGGKGYDYYPERILDDILSTIYGFPPYLAANKPQNSSIKASGMHHSIVIRPSKLISIYGCIHRLKKLIVHSYENPTITTILVPPAPRCCRTI